MNHVFVYGTLTDPDRVDTVLEGRPPSRYELGEEVTLEGLHRVDGRYPTLAPGGSVDGRLLSVDKRGLEALDRYEGIDSGLYVRVSIPRAETDGGADPGSRESVAVYVGDPERLGVADRVDWPEPDGDIETFVACVRRYLERNSIVVRPTG